MAIANFTPHTINIEGFPPIPSNGVARCEEKVIPAGTWDGIPIFRIEHGEVTGLPEPASGTMLIVSLLVKNALPNRLDLASPGVPIRDAEGRVIGCRGLNI